MHESDMKSPHRFSTMKKNVVLIFFLSCCYFVNSYEEIQAIDILHDKYIQQSGEPKACISEDGVPYIVSLIIEITKVYFTSQVPVLLYDSYYLVNTKFQKILEHLLIEFPKGIRHGIINTTMTSPKVAEYILEPYQNEMLGFIIFSKDIEYGAIAVVEYVNVNTKAIFIPQSTKFQIKDFLASQRARRFNNLLVIADPTLKVDLYLQKIGKDHKLCDINLYTHNFATETIRGSEAVVLTSWRKDNFTQNVNLFPDKFKNGFHGIHFVVVTSEIPPYVFRTRGHDSGEGYQTTKWDGIEVRLLRTLGTMLNFSIEFKEPEINSKNFNISVAESTLQELNEKNADVSIGGIYMTAQRDQEFSFTIPHFRDCASFISLTSTALPKYRAIMGPFLWDVWLALTAVYLLAMFPVAFSVWHTIRPILHDISELENMFWYVFGTFTNCFSFSGKNSWSKSTMTATKVFIGSYWIFTIIITACYTGSIIAFITLPVYPEVVDASKELLEKEYRISTLDVDGWEELFTESDDPIAHLLYKNLDLVPSLIDGLRNVTRNVHSDHQSAFLGSKNLLEYTVRANYTPEDSSKRLLFHMSKECFVPLFVGIAMPKKSLYVEKLNSAISRAIQTGFMLKITREVEWSVYRMSVARLLQSGTLGLRRTPEDRELTLDDTQGMFLLLGAGFAIAVFALSVEITMWAVREIKSQKFGEPSLRRRAQNKMKQNINGITSCLFEPIDAIRKSFVLSTERPVSSLFGSQVSSPRKSIFSINHLEVREKPIRLRSF